MKARKGTELHRQEAPNSLGGRKPKCQIQATVAMEQCQIREFRRCSSRTLYVDLHGGARKTWIQDFAGACAIETTMDKSQGPFYA